MIIDWEVRRDPETLVYAVRDGHYLLGRPLVTPEGEVRKVYRVHGLAHIATGRSEAQSEKAMRFDASRTDICTRCSGALAGHKDSVPEGWVGPVEQDPAACKEFTLEYFDPDNDDDGDGEVADDDDGDDGGE